MPSTCRSPEWLMQAKPRLLLLLIMKESKKLMILLGGKEGREEMIEPF